MWQKHEPRASTKAKLQLSEPTGKLGGCGAHSPLRGTICRWTSRMGQGRLAHCPTQETGRPPEPTAGARAAPVKHRAMGTASRTHRKGRSANSPPVSDPTFTISTLCCDARDPLPDCLTLATCHGGLAQSDITARCLSGGGPPPPPAREKGFGILGPEPEHRRRSQRDQEGHHGVHRKGGL